jgi:hypothetical protein
VKHHDSDEGGRALPYEVCHVFTDRPLAGNALAGFTEVDGLPDPTPSRRADDALRAGGP